MQDDRMRPPLLLLLESLKMLKWPSTGVCLFANCNGCILVLYIPAITWSADKSIVYAIQCVLSDICTQAPSLTPNQGLTQIITVISSIVTLQQHLSQSSPQQGLHALSKHMNKLNKAWDMPEVTKESRQVLVKLSFVVMNAKKCLMGCEWLWIGLTYTSHLSIISWKRHIEFDPKDDHNLAQQPYTLAVARGIVALTLTYQWLDAYFVGGGWPNHSIE